MRKIIIVGLAIAGLGLTACSKEHQQQVNEGAAAAADKVGDAAHDIATDPQVKEAGAAVADAAKDDAEALKGAVSTAADKTSAAADKAADDVKAKADEEKAKEAAKK